MSDALWSELTAIDMQRIPRGGVPSATRLNQRVASLLAERADYDCGRAAAADPQARYLEILQKEADLRRDLHGLLFWLLERERQALFAPHGRAYSAQPSFADNLAEFDRQRFWQAVADRISTNREARAQLAREISDLLKIRLHTPPPAGRENDLPAQAARRETPIPSTRTRENPPIETDATSPARDSSNQQAASAGGNGPGDGARPADGRGPDGYDVPENPNPSGGRPWNLPEPSFPTNFRSQTE